MSVGFTPATQLDELFMKEVHREHLRLVDAGEMLTFEDALERVEQGERQQINSNLVGDRIKIARHIEDAGFLLANKLDGNSAYYGKNGARKSQYVRFSIPGSAIPGLEIRIGDHVASQSNTSQLDTYKLGVDGVLRVIDQLADNVGKYEAIHKKHNDVEDVLTAAGGIAA